MHLTKVQLYFLAQLILSKILGINFDSVPKKDHLLQRNKFWHGPKVGIGPTGPIDRPLCPPNVHVGYVRLIPC